MKRRTWATVALTIAIAASGQASAVRLAHMQFQSAVNNCQPALSSFDTSFRKRPLGILNAGISDAFLNCGIALDVSLASTMATDVFVTVINRRTTAVQISCTLIDGFPLEVIRQLPAFFPKTITVQPGRNAEFAWSANRDNRGAVFIAPNMSCIVPADVEFNDTQTFFSIDVGN